MTYLIQTKRELIVEITRSGLEATRKLGRIGGRKRKITNNKIQAARNLFATKRCSAEFRDFYSYTL